MQTTRKVGDPEVAQAVWVCVFLALAVLAVFGQTAGFGFVNYDDDLYVYANPIVAKGLTFNGALWALTYGGIGHWHPLTWLSHEADCQMFGLWAGGHHLTNVALHLAAVLLLFLALRAMTGALWRSAFVAAVFAVHPLRAESVAWIAERKDVLSGMFFMLTLWLYARYVRRPSTGRYAAMALAYGLGLLSKNMLVTLPFVLLLLDYWPLGRMKGSQKSEGRRRKAEGGSQDSHGGGQGTGGVAFGQLVKEKIPLLLLSAGSCVATALVPEQPWEADRMPVLLRVGNALVSCVTYMRQMVFPAGLANPYPLPHDGPPAWKVCAATVVLAGITAGVVACRKKRPYLLVGWLWYLGMLVPVIGIIQISYYAHADRYTYLPEIGLALALTWAVAEGSAGWKNRRAALGGLMAAAAGALTVCGCVQTSYWRDSQSLWTRALSCTSSNSVACLNLGGAYYAKKDWENAIKQYRQALEFRPVYAKARYNLGNAFFAKGDRAGAIEQYRQAVEIKPEYAEAHNNLGIALAVDGKLDEAITHFQKTLEIEPHYAEAQFNLGKALYGKGDREAAIAQYRKALEINPADARARDNLGSVLLELAWMLATTPDSSLRNGARAEALATQASQLSGSGNPAILRTLAAAYAEQGSYGPAAAAARRALEMAARQKQDALAAALQQEIKLYEANKPFRNAPQ